MTCKQVAGAQGWSLLKRKVRRGGPQVLFQVRTLKFGILLWLAYGF